MDYEYLGDALEDALKALEFALNKSQLEPTGMCFNDVGRSIETIEEMKEQIEILEEAIKRYRGRDEDSGLSPEEVQALKRENEALKQEKQDLFREILRLSREKQYYVTKYDNDADELGIRTIDDDFTYGPIYSDD